MNRRFFLYGAAATPSLQTATGWKIRLKMLADRARYRFGLVDSIDYRNYVDPHTYNRGDHAIIVAATQQIERASPRDTIELVEWGGILRAQPTPQDDFVICGSGYFFPNSEGELPDRIIADLSEIKKSGARLQLLGAGFNHLLKWPALQLSSKSKATLRELLELCSEVTVRDRYTKEFLAPFTSKDVEVIGDPALFIDVPPQVPKKSIGARKIKIGINIPFHGDRATEWVRKSLAQFIDALRQIKRTVQCDFFYFVHFDPEVLIAALIVDSGVPVTIINVDASALPGEYAGMDAHIGGMLHSCIIATAAGTPSVCLAYDEKHYGFFELIDSLHYCIDADQFDAELLLSKVFFLLDNLQTQHLKITRRREQLAVKYEQVVQRIVHGGGSLCPLP